MRRNEHVKSLLQQCESHCPTVENNSCKSKTDTWLPADPDEGDSSTSASSFQGLANEEKTGLFIAAAVILGIVGFMCGRYQDDGFRKLSLGAGAGVDRNAGDIEMREETNTGDLIDSMIDSIPSPMHSDNQNAVQSRGNTKSIPSRDVMTTAPSMLVSPMHSMRETNIQKYNSNAFTKPKRYIKAISKPGETNNLL